MKKQFQIYIPTNDFVLTTNKIYFGTAVLLIALYFLFTKLFGYTKDDIIESPFFLIGIILLFTLTFLIRMTQHYQTEPLFGKLEGMLIFNMDEITISDTNHSFESIKKIEIKANDYLNEDMGFNRMDLNPRLSNGTNNQIKIVLKDGEIITTSFQQKVKNEISEATPILIHYYKAQKISFSELVAAINLKDVEEIEAFRQKIQS